MIRKTPLPSSLALIPSKIWSGVGDVKTLHRQQQKAYLVKLFMKKQHGSS